MKIVFIIAGISILVVLTFVIYCCVKVGAESDKDYLRLINRGKPEDSGGNANKV